MLYAFCLDVEVKEVSDAEAPFLPWVSLVMVCMMELRAGSRLHLLGIFFVLAVCAIEVVHIGDVAFGVLEETEERVVVHHPGLSLNDLAVTIEHVRVGDGRSCARS